MQSKRLEISRLSLSLFELALKNIEVPPRNFSPFPLTTDLSTGTVGVSKGV